MAEETTKATTPVGASMTEAAPRTSFDILRTNFIKGGGLSDFVETPWDHNNYRVRFNRAGNICCGEKADQLLLEKPAKVFSLDVNRDTRGTFLRADASVTSSLHVMDLGVLHCSRFLACAKKRFCWMEPSWGSKASEVPPETQFLLIRMSEPTDGEQTYAIILPLLAGSFRTCLEAGEKGTLALRVESGDADVQSHRLQDLAFVSWGPDPFALVKRSLGAVADKLQSFALRESKELPLSLDLFGWCTWDALLPYRSVDGPGILKGLKSLAAGGAPARVLLIDDGWQDTADEDLELEGKRKKEEEDQRRALAASPLLSALPRIVVGAAWGAVSWVLAWPASLLARWYYRWKVEFAPAGSVHWRVWKALAPWLAPGGERTLYKRLRSAKAGERFLASLKTDTAIPSFKAFIHKLKKQHGVHMVFCWHTITGYWAGVSAEGPYSSTKELQAKVKVADITPKLMRLEPSLAWHPITLKGMGLPSLDKIGSMYDAMHSYLKRSQVDGVKVDGQAMVTMMGAGLGGRTAATRSFIQAMEASVVKHFGTGANCINGMCHPTECLYAYKATSVGRAGDDYKPTAPWGYARHVTNVAFNSFFIGEIVQPDWDMFQSAREDGALQACARAVGGCAVYVSDEPGKHDFGVLRRVVLADGGVLRARLPGRPTRDCLFADVRRDARSALKIWNLNRCNGLVAAFNLQEPPAPPKGLQGSFGRDLGAGWGGEVTARLVVEDVEGLVAQARRGQAWALWLTTLSASGTSQARCELVEAGRSAGVEVRLGPRACAVATVARLRSLRPRSNPDAPALRCAAFGLEHMLNGGGAVLAEEEVEEEGGGRGLEVLVKGAGTALFFASQAPALLLLAGAPLPASAVSYSPTDRLLRVQLALPSNDPATLRLSF